MRLLFTGYLCLFSLASFAITVPEKRKTIVFLYDVEEQDRLSINNKFGHIKVELWKRPEIQITVRVTAHSEDQHRLESYLNAVTIEEKRAGNNLNVTTLIDSLNENQTIYEPRKDSLLRNYLQVDYTIFMPAQNGLTISNKFGNTHIPTFKAPLDVFVQNGNFTANSLLHDETKVKVIYGAATVNKMKDGGVEVLYGNLEVKSANIVKLINNYGKLRLGKVNELTSNLSFSETEIGVIHQSALLTIDYSKRFHIERLPQTLTNLDMAASYSAISLPIEDKSNFSVSVSLTNSGFTYPVNSSIVKLASEPQQENNNAQKRYSGSIGKGTGSRLQLIGKYCTVSLQ